MKAVKLGVSVVFTAILHMAWRLFLSRAASDIPRFLLSFCPKNLWMKCNRNLIVPAVPLFRSNAALHSPRKIEVARTLSTEIKRLVRRNLDNNYKAAQNIGSNVAVQDGKIKDSSRLDQDSKEYLQTRLGSIQPMFDEIETELSEVTKAQEFWLEERKLWKLVLFGSLQGCNWEQV